MKKTLFTMLVMALAIGLTIPMAAPVAASPASMTVVSDTTNQVRVSPDGVTYGDWQAAVATWVHSSWPSISGATWISSAYNVEDPVNDSWREFKKEFTLPSNAVNISGSIDITSDNAEELYINGSFIGSDGEVYGPFHDDYEWSTVLTYNVSDQLQTGNNVLTVVVRNYAQSGGSATSNPTGLIYKLSITYDLADLVDLTPPEAYNPIGTSHAVTATVSPAVAGVEVSFVVTGANPTSGTATTSSNGQATFSYTGNSAGTDTIRAYLDTNGNGEYDEGEPTLTVTKYWFGSGFVTGGGNVKDGKKVTYTFGGNVGYLPDGTIVGQFEIVDHTGKGAVSWHCHNAFDSLIFWGDPTESPPASVDHAQFIGTFTSNKGGSKYLRVTIWDSNEPGKDFDRITVEASTDGGATWTTWFYVNPISGGNLQVHEGLKG
jgi:hypothetical protein